MRKNKVVNVCSTCGKSSKSGNACLYESEKMAYCPFSIKMREIKPKSK